jgi:ligand-binding SRPBCC domain-containing protein
MRIYTLTCELVTDRSLRDTFAVFEDPYNLAKITPSWLSFQVTSKEKVQMRKGAEIYYTIKWLGLPMKWKTIIQEYTPPTLFVDEQAKGPYKLWRHRHTFVETAEGVLVGDHVDYALPFGVLGRMAHGVMVGRQLKAIFRYRQQELKKMLGGNTRETKPPSIRA